LRPGGILSSPGVCSGKLTPLINVLASERADLSPW